MPTALQLQREFANDLQVLLVDVQGDDIEGVERTKLEQGWMETGAMWTTVRPIRPVEGGIPYAVMLDADGRVGLTGYVSRIKKDIQAWLEKAREQRSTPQEDLPEELVPAWRALRSEQWAKAIRLAEAVDTDASTDLVAQARRRVDEVVSRLERMVKDGEIRTAHGLVRQLASVDERAAAWKSRFESGALAEELAAANALRRLSRSLFADGPAPRLAEAFDEFAERNAGTQAAARAKSYAVVCRGD